MLKFVRDSFRGMIEFLFVIIIIACAVTGGIVGNNMTFDASGAVLGGIFGFVAGGIIAVLSIGYYATILNIDENLEKIVKSLDKGESVKEKNSKTFDGREKKLESNDLDALKKKMKPNQCIVLVKETSKLVVWDKAYWEKIVKEEVDEYYELVYTNY